MCKYCSKLKQIKDLDEKRYLKIIDSWKRRDLKARKFLEEYRMLLFELVEKGEKLSLSSCDLLFLSFKEKKVNDFIECNYVGK